MYKIDDILKLYVYLYFWKILIIESCYVFVLISFNIFFDFLKEKFYCFNKNYDLYIVFIVSI